MRHPLAPITAFFVLFCVACAGPVHDGGAPGNNPDGSGQWVESDTDYGDTDDSDGASPEQHPALRAIAISPDEHWLYALEDGAVFAIDLDTGTRAEVARASAGAWGVFFGAEGALVVAATGDPRSTVWQVEGAEVSATTSFELDLRSARVSPLGDQLVLGDAEGFDAISLVDLSDRRVSTGEGSILVADAWLPESDELLRYEATPWGEDEWSLLLEVYDVVSGERTTSIPAGFDHVPSLLYDTLAVSPDGQEAALGTYDGTPEVRFVDLGTGDVLAAWPGASAPFDFLPDGSGLVACADDGLAVLDPDGPGAAWALDDCPEWLALGDSRTIVAATRPTYRDPYTLHVLDAADATDRVVTTGIGLGEVAARGSDVFLVPGSDDALRDGLYRLDTVAGTLDETGVDATSVTWLPSRDALLVGDDRGRLRVLDPETLTEIDRFDP